MAYNWEWAHKMGEIFYDKWHCNLYEGNGYMIAIDEWIATEDNPSADVKKGDNCYRVCWFFCDKDHMKRCLGLVKGSYDMFEGNVDKLIIYKDECNHLKDIVDMFTKTQPNIVIEIHPTNPDKKKEGAE